MGEFLVGCPVYKRGWALPQWFTCVEVACNEAGIEPSYVFAGDPRDHDSFWVIDAFLDAVDRDAYICWVEENPDTPSFRVWNHERYHRMVYIRNELLRVVRQVSPDYFLSLDSDVLLHPQAIVNMLESAEKYDVIGGKCFMTPHGKQFPSYGIMPGLQRADSSNVFQVDVIMAIKLMPPEAYAIDYEFDQRGEDLGICRRWKEAGLSLAWDGRVTNKHLMSQDTLDVVDERCGF
jgi:hypothetical protein